MDRVSLLSLLVGSVLPLLVALVTKSSWPEALKTVLLAALSALNGAGTALLHPDHGSLTDIGANALATFVVGAAVAAGAWKPTGLIAKLENTLIKDLPGLSPVGTPVTAPAPHDASSGTLRFDAGPVASSGPGTATIISLGGNSAPSDPPPAP